MKYQTQCNLASWRQAAFCLIFCLIACRASALPPGYSKHTVALNAPPVGLAFDNNGVLYALENAESGNATTIRVIQSDYSFGTDLPIVGDDPSSFYVGGMSYDPVTDSLLITDNSADGRLYSVSKAGVKQTIATGIPAIADVAVRSSGEIFVSTALGDNLGQILMLNRSNGSTTTAATGLDYGAGLAFNASGDLLVLDSDFSTFQGRLHRLPITETTGNLQFDPLELLLDNMQSAAGLIVDSEGDLLSTGSGGLFSLEGSPLAEVSFDTNGNPYQFATAIEFDAGSQAFEPFAGPDGGRLALMADFGFLSQDTFVTFIEPLPPENANFNGDSLVDGTDRAIWEQNFGLADNATRSLGDADGDQDVDGRDFLVWQRQFNVNPTNVLGTTVPEPDSILLLIGGSLLLSQVPRRSRRSQY
ncbi:MAG: hypothetical protein KDA57_01090 [Planctomycetales bacterium]|nr:hypothetical protein [Planctomycetales bacterium]